MTIFSTTEMERRQNAVRGRLDGADAAVVFSFTNSYYLSGAPILHWGRPAITVIPASGPAAMVVSAVEEPRARKLAHAQEIRVFDDNDGPSRAAGVRLLAGLLRERGLRRIAFDADLAPHSFVDLLTTALPAIELGDFSTALNEIRLVSAPEEIALQRVSTAIAEAGIAAFIEQAAVGKAESSVSARAMQAMADHASRDYPDIEVRLHCYSQQGERTFEPHTGSSGTPLTEGNLLQVVVEATAWHYQAAVERTMAVGDLDAAKQKYYETLIRAHRAALDAVTAEARFCDVHEAARQAYVAAGYQSTAMGSGLVRGITSEWEGRIEEGNLRGFNERRLQPNLVITVEPFVSAPGIGATRHCDMVLTTEDGCELLSKTPSGAIRIG